jgi:hypothetical protein
MTFASWVRGGAVVSSLALLSLGVAAPAGADDVDGLWWYDAIGVADAHAQGATGAGVRVAVLDGQITPSLPVLTGADLTVHEPSYCLETVPGDVLGPAATDDFNVATVHGANVTSMIVGTGQGFEGQALAVPGIAPDAAVTFYSITPPTAMEDGTYDCVTPDLVDAMAAAIVQAVDDGARIITTSVGGESTTESLEALAWAQHEGVVVIGAMPNTLTRTQFPAASRNGVVGVESVGPDLQPTEESTGELYGGTVMAPGAQMLVQGDEAAGTWQGTSISQGNSFAAPLVAGMLADVLTMYPDATGNQLIQSLIRNTGGEDHELDYDEVFGYGLASLRHMLRVDPTQYPDVNPLITESGDPRGFDNTAQDIANATRPDWAPPLAGQTATSSASPSPSQEATQEPVPPAPSDEAGVPVWVWVAVGAGVLVLVGIVVAVVGGTRRRSSVPAAAAPAAPAGCPPQQGYPPQPGYGPPQQGYPPHPGYGPPSPGYGPPPGYPPQQGPRQ